jgi:predicted dehydrogenase
MSATRPLRSGIIGTGFMGSVHAAAVRAAGGTVTQVAGRSQAAAGAALARLGGAAAAESAAALIESDDVDVVHICTPNATHAELAGLAIAAGKSVICEKPLATSVLDAAILREEADRAGVVHAVPFVYRFYPAVREARARLQAGEAGPLWLLHGSYLQDWLADSRATNWRVDPTLGGGSRAFGDIGVHWCDLMEFVTGHRIRRLVAQTARAFPERPEPAQTGRDLVGATATVGTEDGATVLFETDQGAIGSLLVSQVSPGRKNRLWFSFDGPDSSFSFNQEEPGTLWVGRNTAVRTISSGSDSLSTEDGRRYAFLPAGHPQGYQDSFTAFVADVYAAVRGDAPDGLPDFRDGLRAALITDAVLESAATGRWVDVRDVDRTSPAIGGGHAAPISERK